MIMNTSFNMAKISCYKAFEVAMYKTNQFAALKKMMKG